MRDLDLNYRPAMFSLFLLTWYLQRGMIFKLYLSLFAKIIAYANLRCNFLFTEVDSLAIYVISGQTVPNDHFMHV
jgi:hypothetical protein